MLEILLNHESIDQIETLDKVSSHACNVITISN